MPVLNPVERTALLTAALRAAETRRPDRLYEDPYAAGLAGDEGPDLLAEIVAATYPPDRPRSLPSTPDYNAIRTRFFDDLLQDAARAPETTQIVLAPAGMDSRAYRLSWPDRIRYFEVDRPFWQRIMGTGNLRLLTTDKTNPQVTIWGAKTDVVALYEKVRVAVAAAKQASGVRVVDNEWEGPPKTGG